MDHLGCRCTNSARVAHRARVAHLASVNHSASVDRRARVAHLDRVAHLSMVDHPANVSHQAVITDARHTCIQRCFWIWFPAHRETVKIFHTNWSKILATTRKHRMSKYRNHIAVNFSPPNKVHWNTQDSHLSINYSIYIHLVSWFILYTLILHQYCAIDYSTPPILLWLVCYAESWCLCDYYTEVNFIYFIFKKV